jgi:hypothetical protein
MFKPSLARSDSPPFNHIDFNSDAVMTTRGFMNPGPGDKTAASLIGKRLLMEERRQPEEWMTLVYGCYLVTLLVLLTVSGTAQAGSASGELSHGSETQRSI